MVRGESNLLVSLYDSDLIDPTLKAITLSGEDMQASMEGKIINVKLAGSKREIRERAKAEMDDLLADFKTVQKSERSKAVKALDQIQKIADEDEVKIVRKDLEEEMNKLEKRAKEIRDQKIEEVKRSEKV